MKELFKNLSDEQLKILYEQILEGRMEGMRPRGLDEYIRQVQKVIPLSFGESWSYVEKEFWDEVGRRYFESL